MALAARGEVESAPGARCLCSLGRIRSLSRSARGKAEKAARVTNDRLELREHLKRYPPGTPIRRKSERQLVLGRRRWIPKQFVRVKVRMRAAGPAHCRSRLVGAAKLFRVNGGECGDSLRPHLGRRVICKIYEKNGSRNPLISMKLFLFGGRDAARA